MQADDDEKAAPINAELAAMLQGSVRTKARILLLFLGIGVLTFVWFAKEAGHPVWLVTLIGVFGAVLIAFAVALVWFWLRFLKHFSGRN